MILCNSIFVVGSLALAGEKSKTEELNPVIVEENLTEKVRELNSAIVEGDLAEVKNLLEEYCPQASEKGILLNRITRRKCGTYQNRPLFCAIESCKTGIVSYLLEAKSRVDTRDGLKGRPLVFAAENCASEKGYADILRTLIKAKSDLNEKDQWTGFTALHWASYYNRANENEALNVLAEAKADFDAQDFRRGRTALHLAVHRSNSACAQVLVNFKANLELKDVHGDTALYCAAEQPAGNIDTVKVLVEAKSQLKTCSMSALHVALERMDIGVIEVLVSAKSELDLKHQEKTPLHLAIRRGREDIVQTLVDAHSELNLRDDSFNADQRTPLHLAVCRGRADIVQILVVAKAELNIRTNSRARAIDLANNLEDEDIKEDVLRILLEAKCDPF